MENIIKELIRIEKSAQDAIQKTEEDRKNLSEGIEKRRDEIKKRFADEASNQSAKIHEEAQKEAKDKIVEINLSYESALEELNRTFAGNRDQWLKSIIGNVTGR